MKKNSSPSSRVVRFLLEGYGARHTSEYYSKLTKHPEGSAILNRLGADTRVKELEGRLIAHGFSATRFDRTTLAMWYLWQKDMKGDALANKHLNDFLERTHNRILVTQWVLGLEVSEPIDLGAGYRVLPISHMPDSRFKEQCEDLRIMDPVSYLTPETAVTMEREIPKTLPDNNPALPDAEFEKVSSKLRAIALLINGIEGTSCVPSYRSSYHFEDSPFGPFNSGGGSGPRYDVVGVRKDRIVPDNVPLLMKLLASYERKSATEQARFDLILNRICQAKRRLQVADKILDLGIALEMLLLGDISANEQIGFTFRLRGSWLLGGSVEERKALLDEFRKIYTARSKVAHEGAYSFKDKSVSAKVVVTRWEDLTCRVFQKVLLSHGLNWSDLVLGA